MGRVMHFEILVEEPDKLAAFYEQVFGWHVRRSSEPGQEFFPLLTGEEDTFGIDGGVMGPHFEQQVIITIAVDDMDSSLETIESHGGELIHGPDPVPGAGMHAYCKDPAGVIFGLLQRQAF